MPLVLAYSLSEHPGLRGDSSSLPVLYSLPAVRLGHFYLKNHLWHKFEAIILRTQAIRIIELFDVH